MKTATILSLFLNVLLSGLLAYQFLLKEEILSESSINFEALAAARVKRIMNMSPERVSIVMLGNSITEGGGNWNERLNLNNIRNSGQGGYTTGQMLWLMDACVIRARPEVCFVMGGINDFSLGIPVGQIFENYKTILEKLIDAEIKPVVQLTLYQRDNREGNNNVDRLNTMLKEHCSNLNIDFIDLNTYLSDKNGLKAEYTTDGTHLTDEGYNVWTKVLVKYINEND